MENQSKSIMKIISYNVNGIRAAVKKGFFEWLDQERPDVIGIQETKAQPDQIPEIIEGLQELGYYSCWHSAAKKGYSGVATFSKNKPSLIIEGCDMPVYDLEGRILRTDFNDFILLNCYFPSGTTGSTRQEYKMEFLHDFNRWIKSVLKEEKPVVVLGDYNIAHTEMDIHDPVRNKKTSGFLPEEREWLSHWFNKDFTDSFRFLHPDKTEYSWWTYRAGARANNKGWRIDYISITESLREKLTSARQLQNAFHSDHCPVSAEFNFS